jgi:hypothetical protein
MLADASIATISERSSSSRKIFRKSRSSLP